MFLLTVCAAILSTATAAVIQSHPHLNSTYRGLKAHKVVASWDDADRICRTEGGHLASPINEDILKDMNHFIEANDQYSTYYIGTRARQVSGQYVSVEGTALEDMPVFEMLERLDPAEGDCLYINEHKVGVVPCWTKLPYICRFNNTSDSSILHNTTWDSSKLNNTISNYTEVKSQAYTKEPGCLTEGYQYSASTGKCYKFHSDQKTWSDAEAICVAEGAHLLVVNDGNEARAIQGFRTYHGSICLGLRDSPGNGDWRSIDGIPVEQLYNVWIHGSKHVSASKCGSLKFDDHKINNYPCYVDLYFMCEKHSE